ncbi:ATP-binding cassette domain-containing protein [Mycoplasmatota bacterium]|nr:ATP-binding cassette domain-containing protein [Mycoplasmatota bacterium]
MSNLSGGEKQRVAIARALVKNPKIIVADEPTGNLDSETSKAILEILKRLSKDKLIIMVTHDEEFVNAYGDRIIQLKDGEIISDKTKIDKKESFEFKKTLELKRSSLPLGSIFNFALNSLFYKKIHLFFMVILLACSIMFVTIATSYNFYDVSQATIKTFNETNINIIPMNKYTDDNDSNENLVSFTNEDYDYFMDNYKSIKFVNSTLNLNFHL